MAIEPHPYLTGVRHRLADKLLRAKPRQLV
jgi:hypothetical protein